MSQVFVSYRRSDAPGHAGRLYDRLVDRFGEENVFKDLDSLEPGADFVKVIEATIARCDALVAVIGPRWLLSKRSGQRRLDDPLDWVRLEIRNALERDIRVIPVLVQGASMPAAHDLPDDLKPLARRHGTQLSETTWSPQVTQLIDSLGSALTREGASPSRATGTIKSWNTELRSGWITLDDGSADIAAVTSRVPFFRRSFEPGERVKCDIVVTSGGRFAVGVRAI